MRTLISIIFLAFLSSFAMELDDRPLKRIKSEEETTDSDPMDLEDRVESYQEPEFYCERCQQYIPMIEASDLALHIKNHSSKNNYTDSPIKQVIFACRYPL